MESVVLILLILQNHIEKNNLCGFIHCLKFKDMVKFPRPVELLIIL